MNRFEVGHIGIARNDNVGLARPAHKHAVMIGIGKHGWTDAGGDDELCKSRVAFNEGLRVEALFAQAPARIS